MLETKTTNPSVISQESKTNWCNILNSYKLGYQFKGSYAKEWDGKTYSGDLTFQGNSNGTISIVKLVINGKDLTKKARERGGDKVPVKRSTAGWDCNKSKDGKRLAWELNGEFVDWLIEMAESNGLELIEGPILWSNYDGKGAINGTKFFTVKRKGNLRRTWVPIETLKAPSEASIDLK